MTLSTRSEVDIVNLWRFMHMDTCPICGGEIWVRENGYVGERDVKKMPGDTVFVFDCSDNGKRPATCGEFQISRVNTKTLEDDWECKYILTKYILVGEGPM
jgi:hypothetical protein